MLNCQPQAGDKQQQTIPFRRVRRLIATPASVKEPINPIENPANPAALFCLDAAGWLESRRRRVRQGKVEIAIEKAIVRANWR